MAEPLRLEFVATLDTASSVGCEFTSGAYDALIKLKPESVEEARDLGGRLDRYFRVTIEELPDETPVHPQEADRG